MKRLAEHHQPSEKCKTPAGYCNTKINAREGIQLVERLPSKNKAPDSAPALHKLAVEVLVCILSTQQTEAGDHKFNHPLLPSDCEARLNCVERIERGREGEKRGREGESERGREGEREKRRQREREEAEKPEPSSIAVGM